MLCISISDKSIEGCLRQMKGADMVELRADLAEFTPQEVATVVAAHPNVMLTYHTTPESEPQAERAIEAALGAGARWVDVEEHASEGYRRRTIERAHKVGAKVVISYHNYSSTPSLDELTHITERSFAMGADVAKVITTAHSTADGATIASLYDHFPADRLVAFAMGAEGAFTRRLSLLLGAPWTYVAPDSTNATAPGQLTADTLGTLLRGGQLLSLAGIPNLTTIPATKSAAQRAIVCAMLAEGESIIENFAPCGDSLAALRVAEQLGCKITLNGTDLHIVGIGAEAIAHKLNSLPTTLHTAESGLLTRLLVPIAATLSNGAKVEITGEGTLAARPLTESIEALHKAGAKVVGSGEKGVLVPLEVCGPITTPHIVIDGSRSSQVASGLMIALPLLPEGTTLTIENPTSVPYLYLTEQMVAAFGSPLVRTEGVNFIKYQAIERGSYTPTTLHLESDWSSAGYFAAAYALAQSGAGGGRWVREEYSLEGMSRGTAQADEVVMDILRGCGANIVEGSDGAIRFLPSAPLQAFEVDATHYPDLVPTLAVVALWAEGVSRIGGLHRLVAKESNRAEALLGELKALGAHITIEGNNLIIEGGHPLHTPLGSVPLRSYGDHRMVMALAVASLFVADTLRIDSTEGVAKSFPTFFDKFKTQQI